MSLTHDAVTKRPRVSEVQHHRARVAVLARVGTDEERTDARRDLAVAKIAQYVERVVAEAPPLTDEQRERLAGLLNGAA